MQGVMIAGEESVNITRIHEDVGYYCECPDCGWQLWYIAVESPDSGELKHLLCGNDDCEFIQDLIDLEVR